MSGNTTFRIAAALGIAILAVSAWVRARANREQQDVMLMLSLSAAADLVHTTNSQALTAVTEKWQADIGQIQTSPTRCLVRAGDDTPPLGDGTARARLVLTNDIGQSLILRLRPEYEGGTGLRKFRVLGYRKTEPGAAGNSRPAE
jgi:hypothetical protein